MKEDIKNKMELSKKVKTIKFMNRIKGKYIKLS